MSLRIGVHPNNLHLQIASLVWGNRPPVDVTFVGFAEGRETGARLAAREIDVGGTGSTPPLIAQAAGVRFTYIAASRPRATNGAIVTRAAGGVDHIGALAGQRIALLDGSFHTSFLAAVLEQGGLRLTDVKRVELSPATSYEALLSGGAHAWIAMAPWIERLRGEAGWRELAQIGDHVPNRSVFWAHRDVATEREAELAALVGALDTLGEAIDADPARYAQRLAEAGIGGIDAAAWRASLANREWTLEPVDDIFLDEQQREADLLARHGELPSRLDVRETALQLTRGG
ncbi:MULTISPECIES: ABC transporter substrate-binding protein [Paraburkholderia]|uniref:ABC transporter substrate-binding protein n=1 Tax=Paraburkholderia TaxID=1822464 RepID=UPI002AB01BF8|nr:MULTISPECIES: ABC transporter substrate-binding protein [Paraburkholderia]